MTAQRYAADVLGWPDAVVGDGEPSEDGRNGSVLQIYRSAQSTESTSVWIAKTIGRRWHGVTGIRHTVYTHCGVVSTTAVGHLWIATPPLADDSGNPPVGYDENNTTGKFFATGPGTAEFGINGLEPAKFRLANPQERDPNANCE